MGRFTPSETAGQLAAGINNNYVCVVIRKTRLLMFRRQMFNPSGEVVS